MKARIFQLKRLEDESGISGTGIIAEGVQFPDGVCVIRWKTDIRSTAVFSTIEDVKAIHGHNGKTKVVWRYQV